MQIKKRKEDKYFELVIPKRLGEFNQWCDKDHLMFISIGVLLENYINDEEDGIEQYKQRLADNILELEDPNTKEIWKNYNRGYIPIMKEIIKLYNFWIALPGHQSRIEDKFLISNDDCYYWEYWEDKLRALEDQFIDRTIKIRGYLWT